MAASNFKPSLSLALAHEGGFSNHPADPGGATNQGITQRVYDAYRLYNGLKVQSVRDIKFSEVTDIYNKNYWKLVRGDSLPCGLDYCVFDFGVNSGVNRAIKYLQILVGTNPDGVLGLITLNAVEAQARENIEAMIAQYCANRMAFLRSLPTFKTFGLGWTRRVVGYQAGVQSEDSGVVDYATFMARRHNTYIMPTQIGSKPNEEVGRAVADDTPETYVTGPITKTSAELKGSLPEINDQLAAMIAAG
jgi:lysozyme family protein